MELKELEYIVAVAEEQSISKAADRLYLAQSSLRYPYFEAHGWPSGYPL